MKPLLNQLWQWWTESTSSRTVHVERTFGCGLEQSISLKDKASQQRTGMNNYAVYNTLCGRLRLRFYCKCTGCSEILRLWTDTQVRTDRKITEYYSCAFAGPVTILFPDMLRAEVLLLRSTHPMPILPPLDTRVCLLYTSPSPRD